MTDAVEGQALRQQLAEESSTDTEITLLSGLFSAHDAALARSAVLCPVVTETHHIHWLQAAGFHGRVWIKIDSGMNRLGAADPAALLLQCREADITVCGLMSHLSLAPTIITLSRGPVLHSMAVNL